MTRSSALRIAALCAGAAVSSPVLACASCGCTLTSDWLSQGLVAQPGTTFGLRYDYIPQTELRSGHDRLHRGDIAFPTDREIEKYTYDHYLTASLDRQFDSDWGLNLQVPFSYRPHATTDEDETELSYSRTGGIGDVRITGRWQGFKSKGSINGIQFGVQLPTGRIHQRFTKGPTDGEEADRGIQPGFGVAQAILGYYRYGKLATDVDYIFQLQGQLPLYRHDLYRPGKIGQVSAGVHYTRWRGVTPQLQLNFRVSEKDRGENSDTYNTGGEQLYVAPGVIAGLGHGASAFAYLQVPVYQRVVGYQLTPRATVSVGLQYRL